MFFSAKQYMDYVNDDNLYDPLWNRSARSMRQEGRCLLSKDEYPDRYDQSSEPITLNEARKIVRRAKSLIVEANEENLDKYSEAGVYKWLRPWQVVPELRNFKAPRGEYAVGVEVEFGFKSYPALKNVIEKIRNWKYITLDREGPSGCDDVLEVTFPPVLYGKFGYNSQAMRYLRILDSLKDTLYAHGEDEEVGTHINVSLGGHSFKGGNNWDEFLSNSRQSSVSRLLRDMDTDDKYRYFGRDPYGYIFTQADGKYLEFKLFNSTTDHSQLRRYVNIAVSLAQLIAGKEPITTGTVYVALERGYNK